MKKCPQCERPLPDDAQQCPYCGEMLAQEAPQQSPAQPQPQPQPQVQAQPATVAPAPQGNGGNHLPYFIIGVLSAIILAGLAWYFLIQPNQEAENTAIGDNQDAPALVEEATQEETPAENTVTPPQETQQSETSSELEYDGADCYLGYVIVKGENVRLRTEPEINDRNIIKDKKGKNLHPKKGEKLPCMDAWDDFYYVDFHGLPCYISKQFAELHED